MHIKSTELVNLPYKIVLVVCANFTNLYIREKPVTHSTTKTIDSKSETAFVGEDKQVLDTIKTDKSKFWDRLAKKYAASKVGDPKAYEHTLSRTKAHLKPSDHMLEIGCGTGSTSLTLAEHVRHITAQDFSRSMIDIAEGKRELESINNVTFAQSGVDDLPTFETYDVVFASSLLHLLPDLEDSLNRIHQSVEPGGLFISKTVCLKGQGFIYPVMLALMRLIRKAPYVNFITGDELENKITQAGFEIIESDDHNHKPSCRFIVARRIS